MYERNPWASWSTPLKQVCRQAFQDPGCFFKLLFWLSLFKCSCVLALYYLHTLEFPTFSLWTHVHHFSPGKIFLFHFTLLPWVLIHMLMTPRGPACLSDSPLPPGDIPVRGGAHSPGDALSQVPFFPPLLYPTLEPSVCLLLCLQSLAWCPGCVSWRRKLESSVGEGKGEGRGARQTLMLYCCFSHVVDTCEVLFNQPALA